MQKYNDPLPGRHGYLANPPFYGSTLVEAANTLNHGSQGNSFRRLPSLNDTDPISTTDRHMDLRGRINPRREPSPNFGPLRRSEFETTSSSVGGEAMTGYLPPSRLPTRRSGASTPEHDGGYGTPPPVSTISRSSRMRRLSGDSDSTSGFQGPRRVSPGSDAGLSSVYPSSTTTRKTSPSPSRHGLPVALTTEGGRLVPRRRSQSPSNSSISDYKSYQSN